MWQVELEAQPHLVEFQQVVVKVHKVLVLAVVVKVAVLVVAVLQTMLMPQQLLVQ
jgi:hypothetical protein